MLSNAVKYTPDAGSLGLDVEGDEQAQVMRLTVWDNGIGIAEQHLARLFQPFVQLDSSWRASRRVQGWGWRWCRSSLLCTAAASPYRARRALAAVSQLRCPSGPPWCRKCRVERQKSNWQGSLL
ncbi:MAG: hypothetical protein IPK16_30460 [Anaerolineales bacterium]|nr:hypothetical protein [Anaerolineales bacterium]